MIFRELDRLGILTRLGQLPLLAVVLLFGCSRQTPARTDSSATQSSRSVELSNESVSLPNEIAVSDANPLLPNNPKSPWGDSDGIPRPKERTKLVAFYDDASDAKASDAKASDATESDATSIDDITSGNAGALERVPEDETGVESSDGLDGTSANGASDKESSTNEIVTNEANVDQLPDEDADLTQESPENDVAEVAKPEQASSDPQAKDPEEGLTGTGKEPLSYREWKDPELVFLFTGRQHGYIEPCGCTGLENAKGGLARRHSLLRELRAKFGDVPAFDVGNQIRRFGRQAELKFQATVDSLETMEYAGVGFGPDDLSVGFGDLVSAVAGSEKAPFVCANVGLYDLVPTHQIVEIGKRRIGITAILGDSFVANINNDEILESEQTGPAEVGLKKAMAAMKAKKCELFVLLAHATMEETRALVKNFPEIQIVVTAGGAGVPDPEPERIPGCFAYIIRVGEKGMYGGVVGIFMDRNQPVRYSRVPLDSRFPDSQPMLDRFFAYQNDLKQHGFNQLGVTPVPHPFDPKRKYVGNQVCAECHDHAADVFANSHHAHATDSIIKPPNTRSEITRIHDPECVSCHVTGWDAQEYTPYESGYIDVTKSAHLHSNGCENCHGPGSRHAAFENGELTVADDDYDLFEANFRKEMRLTLEEAKQTKCYQCHDIDNSPAFQEEGAFERYWAQIEHNETSSSQ